MSREERTRLLRFILVGGSSTLVTLVSYAILVGVSVPYALAAPAGYAAGILNGYTWNRLWTFETGGFHLPEFSRYVAIQGSGLVANLLGVVLLVEALGLDKMPAEILTLVPIVLITFALNRRWTFRPRD